MTTEKTKEEPFLEFPGVGEYRKWREEIRHLNTEKLGGGTLKSRTGHCSAGCSASAQCRRPMGLWPCALGKGFCSADATDSEGGMTKVRGLAAKVEKNCKLVLAAVLRSKCCWRCEDVHPEYLQEQQAGRELAGRERSRKAPSSCSSLAVSF